MGVGMGMGMGNATPHVARARPRPSFVLVHSPLVGPGIWRWVGEVLTGWRFQVLIPSMAGFEQAGPRYWEPCVQAVVVACDEAAGPLVLVGHGEASPLLPATALALLGRVKHIAFVETSLPPLSGFAESAPSRLRARMGSQGVGARRGRARWWDESAMEALVANSERRQLIESELPDLPLDYFDQVVPVPEHWADRVRCSYLWFSEIHRADAQEAKRRKWPVRRLVGQALHMAVRPQAVAKELSWSAAG